MTVCIQCAMEAMVAGTIYTPTTENHEQHMARVHPDLDVCKARRREMEQIISARVQSGEFLMLGMNPINDDDKETDSE